MRFLQRLFSRSPEIDAASAKIDEFTYLLNYRDHYSPILGGKVTDRALAELYLFRAWTTQFGYRIFSSDPAWSEKLIGETVNATKYLGLGIFEMTHKFSVESVLRDDYINLIESRWQKYDAMVSANTNKGIPTLDIIGVLDDFIGVQDPAVTMALSVDFVAHLDAIKKRAITIGLLRAG